MEVPLKSGLPNNSDGSPNIFSLIVSDSGQTQYYEDYADLFGLTDHAATPRHIMNSPTPIVLDISGDMTDVLLGANEAAQITVHGNMVNSWLEGMNLSSDPSESDLVQVRKIDGSMGWATVYPGLSSVKVTGDIQNRSDYTIATLPPPPNLSLLSQAYPPSTLAGQISYDSQTGRLTFQGAVTEQTLDALASLTIQVYANGQPQFDAQGNPITTQVNLLDPAAALGTLGPNAQTLLAAYVGGAATTTVMLAPNLSLLYQAYSGSASPLTGHISYDNTTGQLTLQGTVTDSELNALADFKIQEVDSQGNTTSEYVNVLDPSVALGTLGPNAQALQNEYALLGGVPTSQNHWLFTGRRRTIQCHRP